MAKCTELNINCKGCGRKFRKDERYEYCPDCGQDRKCQSYATSISGHLCSDHGGPVVESGIKGKHAGRPMKTGRQSKSLLANMASKYIEQTKSASYVLNHKSIELIDARIIDLLERTDAESSPDRMARILKYWEEFKMAFPGLRGFLKGDDRANKAFLLFENEMDAAYNDYAAWRQIFEALDLRRKHTESEVKILKDLKAMMTAEEGMELAAQLFAAIMKVLRDEPNGQKYIHLIRLEFEKITGTRDIGEAGTGGEEVIDIEPVELGGREHLYPRDTERSETSGEIGTAALPEGLSE